MSVVPTITLNSGHKIPVVGLGTWLAESGEIETAVKEAIRIGYRHIDAAYLYLNEGEIGSALKEVFQSGIKREDLFITSKLWNNYHELKDVKKGFELSRKKLGLDYLDLFLMHWPMAYLASDELYPRDKAGKLIHSDCDYLETWRGMEALVDEGLVKSIGVSNFNISQLQRLLQNCRIKPAMNQVEIHPKFNNKKLVDFCQANGIAVTAFSPLGNNGVPQFVCNRSWSLLDDEKVKAIAKKYGKSPAQILLRFAVDRGICVIPKSVKPERLQSNFNIFDFKLDAEEVKELCSFPEQQRILSLQWDSGHKYYPFHEDK